MGEAEMPVTNYYSAMVQVVGESTSEVRTDYLTDALGSVVATVDNTAAVVNTYRYKPYGDQLSKSGVGVDAKFLWVGSWGYRRTGNTWAEAYVRARHYGVLLASHTTSVSNHRPLNAYHISRSVLGSKSSECDLSKYVPAKLTYKTASPPKKGFCGSTLDNITRYETWAIHWLPSQSKAGLIVQQIDHEGSYTCCGSNKSQSNDIPSYWEVWSVNADGFVDDMCPNSNERPAMDHWGLAEQGCSKGGNIEKKGYANFYPGVPFEECKAVWQFTRGGAKDQRRCLYGGYQAPLSWRVSKTSVSRQLKVSEWDCCIMSCTSQEDCNLRPEINGKLDYGDI